MYLDWVLPFLAVCLIIVLLYTIYQLQTRYEGFALVQTPNQTYTIPAIEGVTGRYVRIRPSLTGDGYLTISQIQVIDVNGVNVALKAAVTATSVGGSPVDQRFGRILNVNGVNQFRTGVSNLPSCVVDGVLQPRNTLENVFETSVQNTITNDTQYLEIDLSGDSIISSIIYTGRGDAETRTIYDINSVAWNLTQVERVKGMRVEIRDTLGKLTFGGPGVTAALFPTTEVKQVLKITNQLFTVNADLGSSAQQKDTILIPDIVAYKKISEFFRKLPPLVRPPPSAEISPDFIPEVNPVENNKELINAVYVKSYKPPSLTPASAASLTASLASAVATNNTSEVLRLRQELAAAQTAAAAPKSYSIDLSNNIFPGVIGDHPIAFYNDFYVPACTGVTPVPAFCRASANSGPSAISFTPAPISIAIFGTASATAKAEMLQSIELCKKLYVGAAGSVENYIRVEYSVDPAKYTPYITGQTFSDPRNFQVYMRGSCTGAPETEKPLLGVSDMINVFEGGNFVTKVSSANQAWNTNVFKCPLITSTGAAGTAAAAGSGTFIPIPTPMSSILGLIPLGTRKFLIDWIYNRMQRYTKYIVDDLQVKLDAELANVRDVAYSTAERAQCVGYFRNLKSATERRNAFINNTGGTNTEQYTVRDSLDTYTIRTQTFTFTCTTPQSAFPEKLGQLRQFLAARALLDNPVPRLAVPNYIDVRSTVLMDSLSQQFYEFLDGNFAMTYIYDAFPLGTTMLDVRFQLHVHNDIASSYAPINDLKAQYKKIVSATTQTKGVLNQAEFDYESKLVELDREAVDATLPPFEGAVVRIFYEPATGGGIRLTGLIFDSKAVTSFIPELNGAMPVPSGPEPGNINYQPNLVYTKNRTEPLDCSNPDTLKRVMHDYVRLMTDSVNGYPLSKATPPINVTRGELNVTQILGSQQVSDTQCAVTWKESLYDPNINAPKSIGSSSLTEVIRSGLLSYRRDTSTWFSSQLSPDISGFKLFSDPTVPACKFDPQYYKSLYPNRYSTSATDATLAADFLRNDFKRGQGPICPNVLPRYIYNVTDAGGKTLDQYMQSQISTVTVRQAKAITPFATPITIVKPIPVESTLDNLSDLCPVASCNDRDILYSIVDQYNSDATLPGTILSVTHAFTPNKFQCDLKLSIQYGGTIEIPSETRVLDPATGLYNLKPSTEKVVKGTVSYRAGSTSSDVVRGSKSLKVPPGEVKDITMAFYLNLDPKNCSYTLLDASGQNSGYSIQPNTPHLFAPLIYTNELIKRDIGALSPAGSLTLTGKAGSAISTIQRDFSRIGGSAKQALKVYRMQTHGIVGEINTLTSCPNSPACNSTAIQTMIKDYFKTTLTSTGEQIDTILRTSSVDGKSCDATYTTTSDRTLTNRFLFSSTCTINGHIGTRDLIGNLANGSIPLPVTDDQILDIKKELSTTFKEGFIPYKNPSVSAFTTYSAPSIVAPEAIDVQSFGQDSGRNSYYSMKSAQFDPPLVQNLPPTKPPAGPRPAAVKFLRFTPLKTRSPQAPSVNVGKFIFFYDNYPLSLKGNVTNPMGTWEGVMKDVIGPDIRPGWSDAHKKALLFAFRDPIALDAYTFTTALPEMGIEGDPVSWKLEGSSNGTFWTLLDLQEGYKTPVTRFADLVKFSVLPKSPSA